MWNLLAKNSALEFFPPLSAFAALVEDDASMQQSVLLCEIGDKTNLLVIADSCNQRWRGFPPALRSYRWG